MNISVFSFWLTKVTSLFLYAQFLLAAAVEVFTEFLDD